MLRKEKMLSLFLAIKQLFITKIEPRNYKEATVSLQSSKWINAMSVEIMQFRQLNVFQPVKRNQVPHDKKIITTM